MILVAESFIENWRVSIRLENPLVVKSISDHTSQCTSGKLETALPVYCQ